VPAQHRLPRRNREIVAPPRRAARKPRAISARWRGASAAFLRGMQIPLDVTFRGMDPSRALEIAIRTWVDRLAHDHDRILKVGVVIEQPHQRHRSGNAFHVHVNLVIAGHDIDAKASGDEPYAALGNTFRAARRQLHTVVEARRERRYA
jgi:ribosome-associated translation inhibitor RaiA